MSAFTCAMCLEDLPARSLSKMSLRRSGEDTRREAIHALQASSRICIDCAEDLTDSRESRAERGWKPGWDEETGMYRDRSVTDWLSLNW